MYLELHKFDVKTITREHVKKTKSYFLISRTCFNSEESPWVNLRLKCPGRLSKVCEILYMGNKIIYDVE